jgi:DUF1680 family protein
LTRLLFARNPTASYGDYYERTLFNAILGSQDSDTGMMTYFQSTRPGYIKLFCTPFDSFWCCTGSGMENHAKYGDSIYFHDDESLYVNLFIPSRLTWANRGLVVAQETRFPDADTTRLTIERSDGWSSMATTLLVRRPHWCEGMRVTVNGRDVAASVTAAVYVPIRRELRAGDVVEVRLPMTIRVVPLPGAPEYVAFAYGPIVLAGKMGTEGVTPDAQIIVNERASGEMLNATIDVPTLVGDERSLVGGVRPVRGESLTFETVGLGKPRDVRLAPFFRLAHERYNLYWKVQQG